METDTMEKTVIAVHAHPTYRPISKPMPPSPVKLPPSITTVSKSSRSPRRASHKITMSDVCALIRLDHNYCLPFPPEDASKSTKVVKSPFKPIKFMFGPEDESASIRVAIQPTPSRLEHLLKRNPAFSLSSNAHRSKSYASYRDEEDIEVDIETTTESPSIPYDPEKAFYLMNECGRHVESSFVNEIPEDWDAHVLKTGWTKLQRILFKKVVKAFHLEQLARLTYQGNVSEPVLRRTSLDLTSQRVRQALTQVCWDGKLTQWLHGVLIDNLSGSYLSIYFDVLQTLKSKNPALVNRMILLSTVAASNKSNLPLDSLADPESSLSQVAPDSPEGVELKKIINAKAFSLLLKRPWDPFTPVIHHQGNKLNCDPIFIIVPHGPTWGNPIDPKRFKQFLNMISDIGEVFTVELEPELSTCPSTTVELLAEQMILGSKSMLNAAKEEFPDNPIYLIGWGPGAVVAATVSLTEKVAGVICLGFPLYGTFGRRGDSGDPLLQIKHPVLFIVGGRASNNSVAKMDKFRRSLNLQKDAGLIVIRCGDEYLRIGRYHRRLLLVTQSYVDKCITDEIAKFVTESYRASPASVEKKIPEPIQNGMSLESPRTSPVKLRLKKNSEGELIEVTNQSAQLISNQNEGHEFEFMDEVKKIPSNVTLNKRKDYFRRPSADPLLRLHEETVAPITASKLLKQSSSAKSKTKLAESGNSDLMDPSNFKGPQSHDLSATSDVHVPPYSNSGGKVVSSQEVAQSLFQYMMSSQGEQNPERVQPNTTNPMDSVFFDQTFMQHSTLTPTQRSSSKVRGSTPSKPRVPRPKKVADPNVPPKPRSRKPKPNTFISQKPYPKTVIEICGSSSSSTSEPSPVSSGDWPIVSQYGQSALAKLLTGDSQNPTPCSSLTSVGFVADGIDRTKPDSISVPVIQSTKSSVNSELTSKTAAQLALQQGKSLVVALPRLNMDTDQLRAVPNKPVSLEPGISQSDLHRSDSILTVAHKSEPLTAGSTSSLGVGPPALKATGPLSGDTRTKLVKVVRTSDLKHYMSQGGDLTKIWAGSNMLFSAPNPDEPSVTPKLPISFIDPLNPAMLMRPNFNTMVHGSADKQLGSDSKALLPSPNPLRVTSQVSSFQPLQYQTPLVTNTAVSEVSVPSPTVPALSLAETQVKIVSVPQNASVISKTPHNSQAYVSETLTTEARRSVIRQTSKTLMENAKIESPSEVSRSQESGEESFEDSSKPKSSEIQSTQILPSQLEKTEAKHPVTTCTQAKVTETEVESGVESTKVKLSTNEPVQARQSVIEKRKSSLPILKDEVSIPKKTKVESPSSSQTVSPSLRKSSVDFKPKPKKTFEEALIEIDKQAKSLLPTKKGSSVSSTRKLSPTASNSTANASILTTKQALESSKETPMSQKELTKSKDVLATEPQKTIQLKKDALDSDKGEVPSKTEAHNSKKVVVESSKEAPSERRTPTSLKKRPGSKRTKSAPFVLGRPRKSSSPRPPVRIHYLRKEAPSQPTAEVKVQTSSKPKLGKRSKSAELPSTSQPKLRKCKEPSIQINSKPNPVKSRKPEESVPSLRRRSKVMKYVESPENSDASTVSGSSSSSSTSEETENDRVSDLRPRRAKLVRLAKPEQRIESDSSSSSTEDEETIVSEPLIKTSKTGKLGKGARPAIREPELVTLDGSDEEHPRLTRSMRRQSTSAKGEGEEVPKKVVKRELIRCDLDEEEEEDEDDDDDDDDESSQKKKLKPIFPVSPASLSATRTRKVSIPKFFAYGM